MPGFVWIIHTEGLIENIGKQVERLSVIVKLIFGIGKCLLIVSTGGIIFIYLLCLPVMLYFIS